MLEQWRNDGGRHAVVPVPADVDAFAQMLLDVCLDAGGNGLRTLAIRNWDGFAEFVALTPDLREYAHAAVVVLRVQKRSSTRQAALGGWKSQGPDKSERSGDRTLARSGTACGRHATATYASPSQ